MPKMKNLPPDEFDDMSDDPLAKYYRMPGVHVQLPTNGVFMPKGSIEFTMNDDIPVYPMRAADELLLKSPDSLMSGYAVEQLIKSCVPAIKAPRLISSPDLDVLLLAIRAATYGEMLTVNPVCPTCGKATETHVNLSRIIASSKPIPPENAVRLSDEVVAYLRPYNMDNATRIGMASYEETRKVQATEEAEEKVRTTQINDSMQRIVGMSMDVLADCVLRVVVAEGEVYDPQSIHKFILNVSKAWIDKLNDKMDEINSLGIDKHYPVVCTNTECKHEWQAEIEFNPSTFFGSAS